jgi:hypothetical protein
MLAYTVFGRPGDDRVWTVSFTHVSDVDDGSHRRQVPQFHIDHEPKHRR